MICFAGKNTNALTLNFLKKMIQFILMLLGLAFPNNNANTATSNNDNPSQVTMHSSAGIDMEIDTSGGSGQKPPL